MEAVVSSSYVLCAIPSSSVRGFLTVFLCSSVGTLPWDTVLHKLLHCEFFPQSAVLHELLQHSSLPKSAVLQEQTAPSWVTRGVPSPASKLPPVWACFNGVTASLRHPRALEWDSPGAIGGYLLHHGHPWGCTRCLHHCYRKICS